MGILISYDISGGHINSAITISETILGDLPWHPCIIYILAQVSGAFLSSLVLFACYYDGIVAIDPFLTIPGGENIVEENGTDLDSKK